MAKLMLGDVDITEGVVSKLDKMAEELDSIYKKLDNCESEADHGDEFKLLYSAQQIIEVIANNLRE